MKSIRTSVACALALSLSTTAFAGGLRESAEQAEADAEAEDSRPAPMPQLPQELREQRLFVLGGRLALDRLEQRQIAGRNSFFKIHHF